MATSSEIRDSFLQYFRQHGHQVIHSGPLVPPNDPTLMFTNAGMVQFKDIFTGKERRDYQRACSSQKCIRISGKHNDLENVGVTARHHTFFEMLGNFSFGDYFKEQAIVFGWEYLTRVLSIPESRLAITVFGGEGDLPQDTEAEKLWYKVSGLPSERIIHCNAKDNFWQMGETGPCGPCSEIHYFCGKGEPDLSLFGDEPTADGEGWVELWNLVFTQFNRLADGTLDTLPAPSIDTGAGLERLAAVSQGVYSNYDIDLLRPIVDKAAEIANKTYRGSLDPDDVSMRVIADHARMAAFLIAEGVFPERDGRPYVLRRVMRRAIRHAHKLAIHEPCLHLCALEVVDVMGDAYPELVERRLLIADVIQQEEERFRTTLRRGLERLEAVQWPEGKEHQRELSGKAAFELYDTYGFPFDLLEVIGKELNFTIDQGGFEKELSLARERSAGSKIGDRAVDEIYRELANRLAVEFVGHRVETADSRILQLLLDGRYVDRLDQGQTGEVLTPVTPFYAESGGQVGDRGRIITRNSEFEVLDTVKATAELTVHRGRVVTGSLRTGEPVQLRVDGEVRTSIRRNHSATHLLHLALRSVVGEQAMQKGSLVAADRLRFDYSSTKPLSRDQMVQIEVLVNQRIIQNIQVETEVLPLLEAKGRGAIGIFEEKYGDVVRVVSIADSKELCGGTHVSRTGDIGFFKIVSDAGIAASVRRIEATTGFNSLKYVSNLEQELLAVAKLVKVTPFETREKVERVLDKQKELSREIERLNRQLVLGKSRDVTGDARRIGGINVLGTRIESDDMATMREMADQLRDRLAPAVVLLGSAAKDGKALLVCTVSKELTSRIQAGKLIKEVASIVGGSGGGRPDFAQAGGSDGSQLDRAVESIYQLIPSEATTE